jgi:hypothetical protein
MNKPDWTVAPEWADRLMKSEDNLYFWCNVEKSLLANSGRYNTLKFGIRHTIGDFELVEMRSDPWTEGEERMAVIPQNGNDGEHYDKVENPDLVEYGNNNRYRRKIKTILVDSVDHVIYVDAYDVLAAFNVTNPAMAHAIKKMLAPGQRGAKDTIQDMNEAMQSIKRAIKLEQSK